MKNYKILIISLLLLIFMVGAVSAADENVADDNLEISDEISVDEDVDTSEGEVLNVDDNVDQLSDSDEETIADSEPYVISDDEFFEMNGQVVVMENEVKNFTFQFVDENGNPHSEKEVVFTIYDNGADEDFEKIINTDEDGYAIFSLDFPIGSYDIYTYTINGVEHEMYIGVLVRQVPDVPGYIFLYVDEKTYGSEFQVIAYNESITYYVQVLDGLYRTIPNAFVEYSIANVTGNGTTDDRGYFELILDSLPVGVHVLNVTYPEFGISTNTTLHVLSERIPTIIAENMTVVGGNGIEFMVKFNDRLGNPRPYYRVALSEITPTIYGGYDYQSLALGTTDENGVVVYTINLTTGVHNIGMQDPYTYKPCFWAVTVLANSSISVEDNVTFDCEGENSYSMSFTNIDGTPLVNGTIEVIIDDNENYHHVLTTDENGTISVDLSNLPGGNHTISIVNLATGEKTSTTVNLLKGKTSISTAAVTTVYNGGKYVVFTLKNDKGVALSGKSVSVVLNGKTIKGTTDKNGQFKVSTDGLAPKTYSATMTFAGDDYLIGSTATAKITVNKATPKMTAKKATFKTKTKKYTITLKDNKNKAMKKVKVTLKVKGKTYKAKTNAKGKATFKLTKLTKKGKYTAKVKFAGNKNFKAVTKKVKITVKK